MLDARLSFLPMLLAALGALAAPAAAPDKPAATNAPQKPAEPDAPKVSGDKMGAQTNVVLVHGAFADGSSWRKVIPLLEAKNLHVTAVQLPETSFQEDVAATRRTVSLQKGAVVLVGHSYGGMVITAAADDPNVKALVYVTAFAPEQGESAGDQIGPRVLLQRRRGRRGAGDGRGAEADPQERLRREARRRRALA